MARKAAADIAAKARLLDLMQQGREAGLRPFDIMLELKSKHVGLLQLREDLQRFAPELVEVWH